MLACIASFPRDGLSSIRVNDGHCQSSSALAVSLIGKFLPLQARLFRHTHQSVNLKLEASVGKKAGVPGGHLERMNSGGQLLAVVPRPGQFWPCHVFCCVPLSCVTWFSGFPRHSVNYPMAL